MGISNTLTLDCQCSACADGDVDWLLCMPWRAEGHGTLETASFVAGHSLGEYSASGGGRGDDSIADTARLLRIRGAAMQEAVPVGVSGLWRRVLGFGFCRTVTVPWLRRQSQGEVCQAANDNDPGRWWSPVIRGRSNGPCDWPRRPVRNARCCCLSARRFIAP